MKVSDARKRYPGFFETVEAAVWDDMIDAFCDKGRPSDKTLQRICYNAAAIATLEMHKIVSRKKGQKR